MSSTNKTNYSYTKSEIDSMGGGSSLSDTISQKADKSDLSNYLPLSGGNLRNGDNSIGVSVDNNSLSLYGGYTRNTCSRLMLVGADANDWRRGGFVLRAKPSSSESIDLIGVPDGTLTWGGKTIDVIEEQGDGYIRYSNGIQICWGKVGVSNGTISISFPKSFADEKAIVTTAHGDTNAAYINVSSVLASYFSLYITKDENGCIVLWQAIGRWK